MNKTNISLLSSTLAIQSMSKDDQLMVDFIKSELKKLEVKIQTDKYGNIYVTKGKANTYPCIVSHIDTVHTVISDYVYPKLQTRVKGFTLYRAGDILFAFSEVKSQQVGIGGDDKTGVYICLQALIDMDVLKVVFYKDEEIGKLGSSYSIKHHKNWYQDCNFIIQPDRRENSDFITNSGGIRMCSSEFIKAFEPLLEKYKYEKKVGLTTDVDTLVKGRVGISCVNLSSGFYAPHSDNEIVSITDVNRVYNLIYDFIKSYGKSKFPHVYVPYSYSQSPYSGVPKYHGPTIAGAPASMATLFSIANTKYKSFIVSTADPKYYAYKGYDALKVEGFKCSICSDKSVFFLPYEEKFYCTKCNNYVKLDVNTECYRKLIVKDSSCRFVFSWVANTWHLIEDTVWHDGFQSYVLKDEFNKWEEQTNI